MIASNHDDLDRSKSLACMCLNHVRLIVGFMYGSNLYCCYKIYIYILFLLEGFDGNDDQQLTCIVPFILLADCPHACAKRCRSASRKNVCTRACGTCCMRCHCVPPGTYGNRNACPCYASLRTHGGKPKCP